ncbi:hypothetical protein BU14_0982s0004 [Porphyra umbilicalis]|uniref:Uncharacterized protein n=1 Tax=Porphyra umbilicalis TaxID=2786 RepID=A0A1X6NMZ2_PORUM|nr:hypothetical protein BU14_0982s0004 [Porphyra umbilicalis]|eukprot:OSX69957.1 hypothetical protein BU14_0982s0004 [Porphyra umbilicalis]
MCLPLGFLLRPRHRRRRGAPRSVPAAWPPPPRRSTASGGAPVGGSAARRARRRRPAAGRDRTSGRHGGAPSSTRGAGGWDPPPPPPPTRHHGNVGGGGGGGRCRRRRRRHRHCRARDRRPPRRRRVGGAVPPPRHPGYGRLGSLCALQCAVPDAHTSSLANATLTSAGGRCGAFPDLDALDTPPYAAPDGATATALAALINLHWPYAAGRVASSATSTPLRVATPATRRTRDTLAAPAGRPPCAPSAAVPYAHDVAAALRLQRNSVGGAVARVNGKYEVLAVSRRTAGVCLDGECAAAAAVAMVGGGGPPRVAQPPFHAPLRRRRGRRS